MEPTVVELFYADRKETLKILNTGGHYTAYLTNLKNPICPLMGSKIKLLKQLGKGVSGKVFEISFPSMGQRRYVVKKTINVEGLDLEELQLSRAIPLGEAITLLQKSYGIPPDAIYAFNGHAMDRVVDKIVLPAYMFDCYVIDPLVYNSVIDYRQLTINPGDGWVCMADPFVDYGIGVIASDFYFRGISINFLEVLTFALCPHTKRIDYTKVDQYTFSTKITSNFTDLLSTCLISTAKNQITSIDRMTALISIIIQITHAICVLQTQQIVHGDLHVGNVFIERVDETTTWNGKRLIEADYYEYRLNEQSIYVPGGGRCPFVVKIGDYGTACKYSKPMLLNKTVILDGYDQQKGAGPLMPNEFNRVYDFVYMANYLFTYIDDHPFAQKMMDWIYTLPDGTVLDRKKYAMPMWHRPIIKKLPILDHATPHAFLLLSDVVKPYRQPPPRGSKVIVLGNIL